jgi:hypothetical protein
MDLTSESTTAAMIESFAETADPRLREILQELVPHLHDHPHLRGRQPLPGVGRRLRGERSA